MATCQEVYGSHKNLASGVCVCVAAHTLTCVAKCPVESVL